MALVNLSCQEYFIIPLVELAHACIYRENIYRAIKSFVLGEIPEKEDVDIINDVVKYPIALPQLNVVLLDLEWEMTNPL
jgi:hypothetical protein